MASFKNSRVFDPYDLEILERATEAAWAVIVSREPNRDVTHDEERRHSLRKRVFATAYFGLTDAETIRDKVLASMPEYWNLDR